MKTRFLAILAVFALFAIAAYALTQDSLPAPQQAKPTASSCCKKGDKDSCPMKGKAEGEHGKMSCCKKQTGDPPKHDCTNCDCPGDACPIKGRDGAQTGDANDCPETCGCCNAKAKTEV